MVGLFDGSVVSFRCSSGWGDLGRRLFGRCIGLCGSGIYVWSVGHQIEFSGSSVHQSQEGNRRQQAFSLQIVSDSAAVFSSSVLLTYTDVSP